MNPSAKAHRFGTAAWLALAGALLSGDARGDGVAQVMTSKSIPAATVAVIDPESGSSSGGGTTDVRIGPGDIILFQFNYFPVPDKIVHGLQGYMTEYVPSNTEVVGMRIIDANDLTLPPKFPGISNNDCARPCNRFNSVPCNGGTCNLDDGSISQVYADTGLFYTTDSRVQRNPNNAFLTLKNGILMNPEPNNSGSVKGILGTSSPIYAHQTWDWIQVRAYGTGSSASDNNGTGNTPFDYGSPVAGPDTHYNFEATEVSPGVIEFNDVTGPWQRIAYPGSQIGTGVAVGPNDPLKRMNVDTAAGVDVTPNTPLAAGTRAVRVAMGEVRVGEPGRAEIALRVLATPLDGVQNQDVDCGEVFGGDTSAASANVRARDNPWPTYLPSPACVFLNLLFDHKLITPASHLAQGGDTLVYETHGKNLSTNPQTNVSVRQKFESNKMSFVSATGGATVVGNCDGDGYTCVIWPTMTLPPSDEYSFNSTFTVGGGGHVTNVSRGNYRSDQLVAPGFTVQDVSMAKGVAVVGATLQCDTASTAPGGTASLSGTVGNNGSLDGSFDTITILLPAAWSISGNVTLNGSVLPCNAACGTDQPEYNISASLVAGESRVLLFSVNVPVGTATGLYPVDLQIWGSQSGFGGSFETYFNDSAFVAVGEPRSPPPALNCPINSSSTTISGTTTEPDGTLIRVYFNGIVRATAVASGGTWSATGFAGMAGTFGDLYGGLEIRATADGAAAYESLKSAACFATTVPICSDFTDNDGDGLVDFPADPGCDSAADSDESNPIYECSDGLDNDMDLATDYPSDLSCSAPEDTSESGLPQCGDGVDNDGDGDIDFAGGDGGCVDATDADEIDYFACQDGLDNDAPPDGLVDLADPGCHSANDDDETDPPPFNPATDDIRARLLIAFDTSGSMNWNACANTFTGGDGSATCAGSDVSCCPAMTCCDSATCGDGTANDSRLFKVKGGVADAVSAFGEVDFGLMRFHQREIAFGCPTVNASQKSGGWQGGGSAPCAGGFNAGDLLVGFAGDNTDDILDWVDGKTNYATDMSPDNGTPPAGQDIELRASGTTPLDGILSSAQTYIDTVRAGDAVAVCRPYRVILVTDGAESCGGDPAARAASLCAAGIPVDVIGFATPDPTVQNNLDTIADAGCDPSCDPDYGGPNQVCSDIAVLADDEAALSAAIGRVVSSSILRELCNGLDDDCDGATDEDFPGVFPAPGAACDNNELGACFATGNIVCFDENSFGCNAPPGTPMMEVCDDLIDQDCNGILDDGGCVPCIPGTELCNGADDDCDGFTDADDLDFPLPGVGSGCGITLGECLAGTLQCVSGVLDCDGDIGPSPEVCNNMDDNCDGITDAFSNACYTFGDGGCTIGVGCTGQCRLGIETCTLGSFGPPPTCHNEVGATTDICNSLDDDCDGETDEDFPDLGTACDNGLLGICAAPGFMVCADNGLGTECNAPILLPSPTGEICNDVDDDCDGFYNEGLLSPIGDACGSMMCGGTVQCVCDMMPPATDNHTNCAVLCVGGGSGAEVCNNIDDDCDGFTDEAPLPGVGDFCAPPGLPLDEGACAHGLTVCIDGMIECGGYTGPTAEVCNNIDDNCDGMTDNDAVCPGDAICYEGTCVDPCNPEEEFPCGTGRVCLMYMGQNYCFPDPCIGAPACPAGQFPMATDPETCICVDPCANINCPPNQECVDGSCLDCRRTGCDAANEVCTRDLVEGYLCVPDLCFEVLCGEDESCVAGECFGDCSPTCGDGEQCTQGECCVIDDSNCPETRVCGPGEACNPDDGECIPDPCGQAECRPGTRCEVGCGGKATCVLPPDVAPTPEDVFVLIAGEGGCGCRVGGAGSNAGAGGVWAGLVLAVALLRRRRTR